jgi:hypothetical protein
VSLSSAIQSVAGNEAFKRQLVTRDLVSDVIDSHNYGDYLSTIYNQLPGYCKSALTCAGDQFCPTPCIQS